MKNLIIGYSSIICIVHLYINLFGGLSELQYNALHFSLIASVSSLIYLDYKKIFSILSLVPFVYLLLAEDSFYITSDMRLSDIIVSISTIGLALYLLYKTNKDIYIPLMLISVIGYMLFFGVYIPGDFGFAGISYERFLYRMFYTDDGLFGNICTISSTYIFMFIMFSSFLLKSNATEFIVDMSSYFTSKIRGGSAQVAIFSSALMGTVSGSAVANVVAAGSITIPMMKKNGFSKEYAGGVEAASSVGGQIMPPIMGAGAFLIPQFTGIPYSTIIAVSILPAILYYFTICFGVLLYSYKNKIPVQETKHNLLETLKRGYLFFVPIICLITLLMIGYTPVFASIISTGCIILISQFSESRMGLTDVLDAFNITIRSAIPTVVLLVSVGILVGSLNISGTAITFSQMILEYSNSSLLLGMFLVAIAAIFLGLGLPASATYIILAVLCAPALVTLMMPPDMYSLYITGNRTSDIMQYVLSAHLISFWLSQDSNLSPPIAMAGFAAASIAGGNPTRTSIIGWKLGKGLYIIPLLFAYTPLLTGSIYSIIFTFIFSALGVVCLFATIEGFFINHLNILRRFLFFILACFLFYISSINVF